MSEPDPKPPSDRTPPGASVLAFFGEFALEGCLAPIVGVILVVGSIAIFALVPSRGLAILLVVLLVSIPLIILYAVRSVRRGRAREAGNSDDD